jgi:class 3 adenylate cyclase
MEAHARTVIADLDQAIASIPGDGAPPEALGFRELAKAEFSRLTGAHDPGAWRRAGERFQELDERLRVAYTQFRAAEALALAGQDAASLAEPLRAAHAAAVEAGARPFQEQVEGLARRVGVTLEQGPPGGAAKAAAGAEVRSATRVDEVAELLAGSRRGAGLRQDRVLATVVFTDIVGSTALAAELGDQRWRELLDRHDGAARRELRRFGGIPVQFIGDGMLAAFDAPVRAIECTRALIEAMDALGLEIRAGIHTGEIELRGSNIGGIAVHIGARIAALAGPSEILVSQTVVDLVTGSGLGFEPRGDHMLKGVPATWQLHALAPPATASS